jgi:hypothetical protein
MGADSKDFAALLAHHMQAVAQELQADLKQLIGIAQNLG